MLTGLYLDAVFLESFLCTGVISAFFKFDGNTNDAMQFLRLKRNLQIYNFNRNICILASLLHI